MALVDTKGWSYESEQQLIESMRRNAAELGANALVLDANPPQQTTEKVNANVNRWSAPRARALAIFEKR